MNGAGAYASAVRAAVADSWPSQVDFLRRLVRAPSVLGQELGAQTLVANELAKLGLEPRLTDVDAELVGSHPAHGRSDCPYSGRPNVSATWHSPQGGGKSLLLNGHIDVVPTGPAAHWTHDPWEAEICDGRMVGRGAADMKAGIAANLYAVHALRTVGVELAGDLLLESVIEEECTGNGTLACRLEGRPVDGVLIPEPFGPRAVEAQVGVLWARITVVGRAAHAESADGAENAVTHARTLIDAVARLEALVNAQKRHKLLLDHPHPLNYTIGQIQGGAWPSSVPDECTLYVRLAAEPGESLERVMTRFTEAIAMAAADDAWLCQQPPRVEFTGFRADGFALRRDTPLFGAVERAHSAVHGRPLEFQTLTCTTDARFFPLYFGTPATCYGPTGGNLHAPNEWVDLDSVQELTRTLALTAIEWCGVAGR